MNQTPTERRSAQSIADLERMPWVLPSNVFPDMLAKATVYRERVSGLRHPFQSAFDASEYERGYCAYPAALTDAIDSPAVRGWFDAERRQELRDETLADAAWCEAHE